MFGSTADEFLGYTGGQVLIDHQSSDQLNLGRIRLVEPIEAGRIVVIRLDWWLLGYHHQEARESLAVLPTIVWSMIPQPTDGVRFELERMDFYREPNGHMKVSDERGEQIYLLTPPQQDILPAVKVKRVMRL